MKKEEKRKGERVVGLKTRGKEKAKIRLGSRAIKFLKLGWKAKGIIS